MVYVRLLLMLLVGSICCVGWSQEFDATDVNSQGPDLTQIRRWISQLDAERFAVREAATQQLVEAGPVVIDLLSKELSTAGVEVTIRGLDILRELALQNNVEASRAEYAIRELAEDRITTASHRAAEVLKSLLDTRTIRGEKALRQLGASFTSAPLTTDEKSLGSNVIFVTLGKAWKGNPSDLALLEWLAKYQGVHVTLHGKQFDDQWLQKLVNIPTVIGMQLNRASITDDGIAMLVGMPQLRGLSIRYCQLTNASCQHLNSLSDSMVFVSYFGKGISKEAFDKVADQHKNWNTRYGRGGFLGIGGAGYTGNGIQGCIVSTVTPNQAASMAGIREFDIITAYNGEPVTEFVPATRGPANNRFEKPNDSKEQEPVPRALSLSELIGRNEPGDSVTVTVLRSGKTLEIPVVLGEWP